MNKYLLLVIALVLLSGCTSRDNDSIWGTYQEPIQAQTLPQDSGANELKTAWRKDIGSGASVGFALLKPAYYNGRILVASRTGMVFSFDAETGVEQWQQDLKIPIFAAIGVNDNFAIVTHDNGNVSALNATDGTVAWTTSIKRQISAIPAVGGERVIIRTADGLLIGLDMRDGNIVWQIEKATPGLSVHGDSTSIITGDAVLTGLASGKLIANNILTGRDYWEVEISFARGQNELERLTDSDTSPIVRGATVYAATYQGSVIALQLQDVVVKWRTKISTRLSMAIAQNRLFVIGELGDVIALNSDDGSIVWQQQAFRGHGISQPVVLNNRVIVGDSSGRVHTLDSETGMLIESKKVVSGAVLSLITENSQFAVLSSTGKLVALTL